MTLLKRIVKTMFHAVGYDAIPRWRNPAVTLLGLCNAPVRTVIDVGANTGQFAKTMRRFFPDATVHCFEPLPAAYDDLDRWAKGEGGKVVTYGVALGDGEGDIAFFRHLDHSPSSSLLKTTKTVERIFEFTRRQAPLSVPVRTMDRFIAESNVPIVPDLLIKLDVQGYEDRVIRGGAETMKKASACILEINLEGFYERQADFRDLTNQFHDLGFRYAGNLDQNYGDDGRVLFIDAVFVRR